MYNGVIRAAIRTTSRRPSKSSSRPVPNASTAATGVRQPPPSNGPAKNRTTEPSHWQPFGEGGPFGIIPRRGVNPLSLFTSEQLREIAVTNPLRLVTQLPDMHPSVDMALNTALRLTCGEDMCSIVAEDQDAQVDEDGNNVPNQVDTASINAMWEQLPPEVGGGLRGLRTMLMVQALLTGQPVAEAVPGPLLKGVARVWPADALTTAFTRPDRDSDLVLRQHQRYPKPQPATGSAGIPYFAYQWIELPADRVFWRAMDQGIDNPHGRAPYASAMNEVIADLALMQDLRDAVHNAAWPRIQVGVNLAELHKVAVEVYRITDPLKAAAWVTARFQEVVDYVGQLNADDNVVNDSSGEVKTMAPGSFTGLEGVLSFLRQRIAQSLKTLPTLLGINDGSTFNYTSVEWAIYAQSLESSICIVDEVLVDIANFHLRLIGSKAKAKAIRKSIRTNDAQVDANTLSTTITNATNLQKLGHIGPDQGSMMTVKKKPFGPAQPGVIEPIPPPPVAVGAGGGSAPAGTPPTGVKGTRKDKPGPRNLPPGNNQNNRTGTTQEERNTKKGRPGSATLIERLNAAFASFRDAFIDSEGDNNGDSSTIETEAKADKARREAANDVKTAISANYEAQTEDEAGLLDGDDNGDQGEWTWMRIRKKAA